MKDLYCQPAGSWPSSRIARVFKNPGVATFATIVYTGVCKEINEIKSSTYGVLSALSASCPHDRVRFSLFPCGDASAVQFFLALMVSMACADSGTANSHKHCNNLPDLAMQ